MSTLVHEIYLKVGADVYAGIASDVNVPGVEPVVWDGSTDDLMVADVPVGQRKLAITARQDWKVADGLCRYLLANEGQPATVVFSHVPGAVDGVYFSVDVPALMAPQAGGKLNNFAEFSLSMPCGKPAIVAAPVG